LFNAVDIARDYVEQELKLPFRRSVVDDSHVEIEVRRVEVPIIDGIAVRIRAFVHHVAGRIGFDSPFASDDEATSAKKAE